MSIVDEIARHLKDKRLFEVAPESRKDDHVRRLFVTPTIQKELVGPYQLDAHKIRMQQLFDVLQGFASGRKMTVSLKGRKHKKAMLGRMDAPKDEVWELRDQQAPGLRLTGRFASLDCFVAIDWYPRSMKVAWSDKEPIRDDESIFRKMKRDCQSEWDALFPNRNPVHGDDASVYLTRANSI